MHVLSAANYTSNAPTSSFPITLATSRLVSYPLDNSITSGSSASPILSSQSTLDNSAIPDPRVASSSSGLVASVGQPLSVPPSPIFSSSTSTSPHALFPSHSTINHQENTITPLVHTSSIPTSLTLLIQTFLSCSPSLPPLHPYTDPPDPTIPGLKPSSAPLFLPLPSMTPSLVPNTSLPSTPQASLLSTSAPPLPPSQPSPPPSSNPPSPPLPPTPSSSFISPSLLSKDNTHVFHYSLQAPYLPTSSHSPQSPLPPTPSSSFISPSLLPKDNTHGFSYSLQATYLPTSSYSPQSPLLPPHLRFQASTPSPHASTPLPLFIQSATAPTFPSSPAHLSSHSHGSIFLSCANLSIEDLYSDPLPPRHQKFPQTQRQNNTSLKL